MVAHEITALILTFNEVPNIARTLARLSWATQILIVDSFSTDETCAIARSFANVRIVQRAFDSFAAQCNFGLDHIESAWVLSLDADYGLSEQLITELATLKGDDDVAGYSAGFKYCIAGQPLRGSLYPPRIVLYRRVKARYRDEGHGHRVHVDGTVRSLQGVILHDDRKSFRRWLSEQQIYMVKESRHLLEAPASELSVQDRLRRWIVIAPPLVFVYTLIVKGLVLDGWRGWLYVGQRTLAEVLLSFRLAADRLRGLQ